MSPHLRVRVACAIGLLAASCAARTEQPPPPRLPPIAVEELAMPPLAAPGTLVPRAEPEPQDAGPPVTVTALNEDVRRLLPVLAEAAGVSLILGPDVRGLVSIQLENVPAREALRLVLDAAGLAPLNGSMAAPWGPAVFYELPVNVNYASAAALRARYRVQEETARWVVEARDWTRK